MNEHLFLQQVVSFQRVTLESSFPCNLTKNVFSTRLATFHDHRISLLVNKQTFLDSSVEHWNDKRGGTGMSVP
ncbi:MAG: hypothetical protein ACR5K3_00325 [Wolbachia sp.]